MLLMLLRAWDIHAALQFFRQRSELYCIGSFEQIVSSLIYSSFVQYQILMEKLDEKVGKYKKQCTHLSSSRRRFELPTPTTKEPQLRTSFTRQELLQGVFLLIMLWNT
jgi:hypothetical protein